MVGDTIVACATAWGRGAVALVRLSGAGARSVVEALCPGGPPWRPRRASLRRALDEDVVLDDVLVTWFPGPRSYTGEDVVELSGHGNPVVVAALLDRCVALGARPARPGEFTRRAVEHGRMDLLQAESLAGLVAAASPAGVALARAGMEGALGAAVAAQRERLLDLAAELEARLDHPGDDLGFEEDAAVADGLRAVSAEAAALAGTWRAGRLRLDGARVALVGPVNAGKSSLFNALVDQQRALVSPEPGTTRDVVEKTVPLGDLAVTFLDTAGERGDATGLEAAGQDLGRALTADADLRLVVLPLHRPLDAAGHAVLAAASGGPHLVVGTHADRVDGAPAWSHPGRVHVASGATGDGLPALRQAVAAALLGTTPASVRAHLTSQRQHDLLRAVAAHVDAAADALLGPLGPAVAAEEATRALDRLAEATGEQVREAVLDRLFARFCVGK